MKLSKTYLLFFLLLAQSLAFAQLPPALMHKQGDKSVPLRVDSVDIKITAVGNIARTEMTLVFYNDLDRRLEGQLYFPLAEGQTVSAFALDVDGQMREGVVVEKQKGRKVFEDIVKRGIDPGLLEYVKGNNFSARVYPIPAKGTRKIRIAYEEGLNKNTEGYQYKLPLQFAQVKHFSLVVESREIGSEPLVKAGKYAQMAFEKRKGANIGKMEQADFAPNQPLEITFPHKEKLFVYQGLGNIQNREYFYAHFQPQTFSKPKPLPQRVALVWDMSGSAENRDFDKEFTLLKAYFFRLGNASVELITFNNELRETYRFTLKNGDWQPIRKQIEALNYDGGTQLGILDLAKIEADEILFSSDGLSNLGKLTANISEANGELMQTPIHTISSLQNAEFAYLRYLAEATGGHFLNLNQISAQSAVKLLESEPYRFLSATYQSGEIAEVFPSKPVAVNGNFAISGVLLAENASITLNFGFNGEVKYSETIKLGKKGLEADGTAERIWASLQLQELDRKYQENEDLIASIGTEYSIVTRNTSLIVLERLDDYFRYKIKPPKPVWEEICAKYKLDKDAEWQNVLAKAENRGIKPYLIEKWEARKKWYFNDRQPLKGKVKEVEAPELEVDSMYDFDVMDMGFGGADDSWGDSGGDSFGGESEEVSFSKKKSDAKSEKGASAKIKLAPWSAITEYVKKLEAAQSEERYKLYLEMKPNYVGNTGFYADVADFFLHQGDTNTALLVASNIAELQLDNHEMLRLLASLLKLCNRYDLAIEAHKQVLELRDDEIQSYRDLALAYEGNGEYQLALNTFYEALLIDWAQRRNPGSFGAVLREEAPEPDNGNPFDNDPFGRDDDFGGSESAPEMPASFVMGAQEVILEELNRLVGKFGDKLDISQIDKRILKKMPLDMRIAVSWDSDNFDMDLWVTDPNGEKCYYAHRDTEINGKYTYDNTSGYGPEEFLLKDAIAGKYKVEMNYYGTRSQKMLAPVTVTVDFFINYGLQSEEKQTIVLRLGEKKEVVYAGEIEFDPFKSSPDSSFAEAERYEEISLENPAQTFKFSPDESKLAVVSQDEKTDLQRLQMFDLATGGLVWGDSALIAINSFEPLKLKATGFAIQDIAFAQSGESLTLLCRKPKDLDSNCDYRIDDTEKGLGDLYYLEIRSVETGKLLQKIDLETGKDESWSASSHLVNGEVVVGHLTNYLADSCGKYPHEIATFKRVGEKANRTRIATQAEAFTSGRQHIFVPEGNKIKVLNLDGSLKASVLLKGEIESFDIHRQSESIANITLKNGEYAMFDVPALLDGKAKIIDSYTDNEAAIWGVSYLPSGIFAYPTGFNTPTGFPVGVKLIDAQTFSPMLEYFHTDYLIDLAFSPKGTYLASSSADKTIRYRNLEQLAVAAQSEEKKEEAKKPMQRLNTGEYAYEIVGKTMVLWQGNEFSWSENNVLTAEQFEAKDSLFPAIAQFMVFESEYGYISLEGNKVSNIDYADYLEESSAFWYDPSSIFQTELGTKIYLKMGLNWQIIDIAKLNKIFELYQQKKKDKAIRKQLWKELSEAEKEGILFNSNTMEEAIFDPEAWRTAEIHTFALQPLALPLLKIDSESSNLPVDGISTIQFNQDKSKLVGIGENLLLYNATDSKIIQTFSDLPEAFTENHPNLLTEFSENGQQVFFKILEKNEELETVYVWNIADNQFYTYSRGSGELDIQSGQVIAFQADTISIFEAGKARKQFAHGLYGQTGIPYHYALVSPQMMIQYKHDRFFVQSTDLADTVPMLELNLNDVQGYSYSNGQLFIFSEAECLVFDSEKRKLVGKWEFPVIGLKSVAAIPNTKQIITTHYDQAMRVWDVSGKAPQLLKTYFGNDFENVYYDSAKKRIVSQHKDGVLCEWEF